MFFRILSLGDQLALFITNPLILEATQYKPCLKSGIYLIRIAEILTSIVGGNRSQ
jgi:hypothetical protein